VVAGVVLLAAALLLWPFANWSWWPVVIGFGVLVVLYVSRLDRLLFGWAPHLAGLVAVVLMAARSDVWAWGLAVGLAVLGVGFTRWPERQVLAVGAALVVVFGAGYAIVHYRTATERHTEQARAAQAQATNVMAISPDLLVLALTNSIAGSDAPTACALLGGPAGGQLASSVRQPDCPSAVGALASRVTDASAYRAASLPAGSVTKRPDHTVTVDACRPRWPAPAPGPPLGRFTLRQYQGGDRYVVTGYAPCR
jgi:hypothetical protein